MFNLVIDSTNAESVRQIEGLNVEALICQARRWKLLNWVMPCGCVIFRMNDRQYSVSLQYQLNLVLDRR